MHKFVIVDNINTQMQQQQQHTTVYTYVYMCIMYTLYSACIALQARLGTYILGTHGMLLPVFVYAISVQWNLVIKRSDISAMSACHSGFVAL